MNYKSSLKKHLPKILTYRIINSIIGFFIIWMLSKSLIISVLFFISEIIYKPILFLLNEIFWEKKRKKTTPKTQEIIKSPENITETTIKRLVYTKKID